MPRAKTNKLYRTFVKGMITEASPLTYPEDSSINELNTVISRKGNRTRRKGIRYEDNFVLNEIPRTTRNDAISEYVWHSVAKIPNKRFVVVQFGQEIHFWNLDETPVSDNKHSYILDLAPFKTPSSTVEELEELPVNFSSGAGYLFLAHPKCDPIVIEYSKELDSFTAIRVVIQIRDFEGVYDSLANDEEPSTLSKEHHYNLKNQGWVGPGGGTAGDPPEGGTGDSGGGTYYDPYTGESKEYNRFYPEL